VLLKRIAASLSDVSRARHCQDHAAKNQTLSAIPVRAAGYRFCWSHLSGSVNMTVRRIGASGNPLVSAAWSQRDEAFGRIFLFGSQC
jgi:hypothetical protein